MKKILLYITILCFISCQDFLDETSKGKVIPENIDDMGRMLDDFFGWKTNNIASGCGVQFLLSDNVKVPAIQESDLRQYATKAFNWEDHIYNKTEVDEDWEIQYRVIYICNWILERIDDAPESPSKKYSRELIRSSAKVHRAYAYFQLINLYAKHYDKNSAKTDLGIPMPLKSDINKKYPRSTVQEVYNQIFADLENVIEDLPEVAKYRFRPSKFAVYAIYARIYLYMGDYENCWKNAEKALAINKELLDFNSLSLKLMQPDFGIIGYENYTWDNPEVIFLKDPNSISGYGKYLSDDLLNKFDQTNDLRYKLFVTNYLQYDFTPSSDYRIVKYLDNCGLNMGDLYLMFAEAKARDNQAELGLEKLNELRKKRYTTGYADLVETDKVKILDLILEERRRETMFQGVRWFDLKRLNKEDRYKKDIIHDINGKIITLKSNSNKYILPIPQSVMSKNSLLEQNPR